MTTTPSTGSAFTQSQISSLTASAGSTSPAVTSTSNTAAGVNAAGAQSLAGNFNEFLTLLTTQLQNQDPLSPMDTNQFTQQLVEFSSVEQQINMNQQMTTLISLQQNAQSAQSASFLGATVSVNGATAQLVSGQSATWNYSVQSPATATINVTNSAGQTVFTQSGTIQPGQQQFTWNGIGTNGQQYPPGAYTISVTATGASGQPVAVSTQVQGTVSAVDVAQNPPTLTVNGQNFALSQILSVMMPGSSGSSSNSS
jgi:flagellar basal-body rod modification protein FlgD